MTLRVLVTGASGLLGRATLAAFQSAGYEVKGTAFSRATGDLIKVDLQDTSALEKTLQDYKPEIVVHCAAERRPDVAEKDPEAARRLNVDLVATLSALSRSSNPFTLLYISTDYVFDGQNPPAGGYTSADPVNPTNEYARTKEAGEQAILAGLKEGGKGAVLRVPVLYGDVHYNAESAINILLDVVREVSRPGSKEVKMDNWASRRPTNVTDVARVLVALADKSITATLPPILSFSAQPDFTKYDICLLLASAHPTPLDLTKLVPVNDGPKEGETIRPRDCWMSNAEIEAIEIDTKTVDLEVWLREWVTKA